MKKLAAAAIAVYVALVLYACGGGGGGGGGNRPPVAPEPTCGSFDRSGAAPMQVGGGNPDYIIPRTTQVHPQDAGIRAHTNHIILAGSVGYGRAIGGLTPTQVRGAYGDNGSGGGAIAIVDAFNYPTALDDFNLFSGTFALPAEPSTSPTASSNQVFQVVYASGSKPTDDAGWSQEAALDIEWAHAMAPGAKVYLVEAASDLLTDLMHAVNVAKALPGVRQVSMSFGSTETACSFVRYNSVFLRNGVAFFSSAGDAPADRSFPAESYNVVAVGGTSLSVNGLGQWQGESAWSSTGCGPSAFEPRPVYQDSLYPKIGRYRSTCDIAAVGDPATGVAVYDSTPADGVVGWSVIGGTSASCPIIAGCVNATNATFASSQALNAALVAGIGSANLHDIISGSAGPFGATAGWDFPSGAGSPNGLSGLFGA